MAEHPSLLWLSGTRYEVQSTDHLLWMVQGKPYGEESRAWWTSRRRLNGGRSSPSSTRRRSRTWTDWSSFTLCVYPPGLHCDDVPDVRCSISSHPSSSPWIPHNLCSIAQSSRQYSLTSSTSGTCIAHSTYLSPLSSTLAHPPAHMNCRRPFRPCFSRTSPTSPYTHLS